MVWKHFAATIDDGVAHVLDDAGQLVGSNMWVRIGKDIRVGAVLAEHVQNLVYAATLLAAGVELAVAVGTSATLAEAVVTLAIHLLGFSDVGKVFFAFTHVLSTFQDDGAIAQFDESQGGKESARSLSHHDDSRLGAHIRVFRMHILIVLWIFVDVGTHLQIDEDGALAGVDAAFEHTHLVEGSHVESLLLGEVALDAFLAGCLFWQNSYLIFLNHLL